MCRTLAAQGLDELFDGQHRDAQSILRLEARREHGGKRILRHLSHREHRVHDG